MRFVRPILAALLLTFGLSGCYTKFFADDDVRPTSRTYAEPIYSSDVPEGEATVMIQEYIVPDLYLTWRTWGFSPFWYEPWFDPFFASPWWPVGYTWSYAWLPYWAPHRAWYWNGYLGWNSWGWFQPLFWGSPNAVILPVFPASAYSTYSSTMRQFGRIRQGSLLPDAVQTPRDMETVSPNRSSSEVAPDKRAIQRSVSRSYHTLPRISTDINSINSSSSSSSGLRPSTSSGSTIQQSSGSLPSRSSSGSSSPSSTSGTRTSGRNRQP
jgi:hypothetical protein